MCNSKDIKRHWEKLPIGGALDVAIADVMDNVADQVNDQVTREYLRQNLMALINITRQVTARELLWSLQDQMYDEMRAYTPWTIKDTLRGQQAAYKALSKPSTDNGSFPGTDTKKGDEPF